MLAQHEFHTDSKVCRPLHALDFFFVDALGFEDLELVHHTFLHSTSGICIEIDPIL